MLPAQPDFAETQTVGPDTRERYVVASPGGPLSERPIVSAGVSLARPGFRFVRRRPRQAAVLCCFGGEGEVWVDGRWRSCRRGQAYVLPAKSGHAYRAGARWTVGWVTYSRGAGTLPVAAETSPLLLEFDPEPLRAALLGLVREARGAADPVAVRHWSELVHLHLERLLRRPGRERRLDRLWAKVEADPARPWNVPTLAAELGLSEERLRQLSAADLGRSPMRHVAHLRLTRAAHLLRASDMSAERIAEEVGYADPAGFSRAFRRWSGLPPRSYRNGGDFAV